MIKLKNLLTENAKLPYDIRAKVLKVLKKNNIKDFTIDKGTDYNETTDDYILKMHDISLLDMDNVEDGLRYMGIIVVSAHYEGDRGIVTFDV